MSLAHKKLLGQLGLALGLVLAINTAIFALHWGKSSSPLPSFFAPPDALIGTVWVVLFALMGVARWNVLQQSTIQSRRVARCIVWFMLFCFSYPLYTLGLTNDALCLVGNVATFAAALWLVLKLRPVSSVAAWLVSPVLLWLLYATALSIISL